jgi:signal transduction histidine kinase/CheY-like chemotaxis protein
MIDKIKNYLFPKFSFIRNSRIRSRIVFFNNIILLALFITSIYFFVIEVSLKNPLFNACLFTFLILFFAFILLKKGRIKISRLLVILFLNFNSYFISSFLGKSSGHHYFFIPIGILAIIIFDITEFKLLLFSIILPIFLILILFITNFKSFFELKVDSLLNVNLQTYNDLNFITTLICTLIVALYFSYIFYQRENELKKHFISFNTSKLNLNSMINNIEDVIFSLDREYNLIEYNLLFANECKNLFGIEVFYGYNFSELLLHSKTFLAFKEDLDSSFRGNSLKNIYKIRNRTAEFTFTPIPGSNYSITAITARDITELKKEEDNILALISSLDDIVFQINKNLIIESIWTKNESLLYKPKNELIGNNLLDIFPVSVKEELSKTILTLSDLKQSITLEYSLPIASEIKFFSAKLTIFYPKYSSEYKISILVRDITDKKRFIQEINKANEIAFKAKQQELQFLSNMSHEIRTPLYGVIALIDLILKEKHSEKVNNHLEIIKYSANNLLLIVNDILDFSKIESGEMVIENDVFSLNDLIISLVKTTESLLREKNVILKLNKSEVLPDTLLGDALRLSQVLQNLLTNAAKFTLKGEISLNIEPIQFYESRVRIRFDVMDTGIGIAEEELKSIFNAYFQKKSGTTSIKGTSLGLTISKKLVELQKGTIQVKSELGIGSCFSIELDFDILKNEKDIILKTGQDKKEDLNCSILLVDDHEMNRFIGQEILKSWKVKVDIACDGEEAVLKTNIQKYDIILMDIQMPILSGDMATIMIRENSSLNSNTPIIALTADVFDESRKKALDSGMNDFIYKPFQLNDLYNTILKYLPRKNS